MYLLTCYTVKLVTKLNARWSVRVSRSAASWGTGAKYSILICTHNWTCSQASTTCPSALYNKQWMCDTVQNTRKNWTYSRPLANTVWKHLWCLPFHLQCKCSTCTCKHVHNVVECNTNTEYIEHWDVIITHHWYGVCSISSDYCSAMSNREYLHVHNCDSVMIASVWVANYSYSKAEDQGRPHVATGIGGRRTASTLLATGHWPSLQFCINIVRLGSAAYLLRTWTGNDTVQQLQGWGCFDV